MTVSVRLMLMMVLFTSGGLLFAQCPSTNFNSPATSCITQNVVVTNTTTGATSYEWDFCSGDLKNNPAASQLLTLNGYSDVETISLAQDDVGNWFGFFLGRQSLNMGRLDFGGNLGNASPVLTNLGNPGNLLNLPTTLRIMKENGLWYGLALSTYSATPANGQIIRLDFGANLSNLTPTAQVIYSGVDGLNSNLDVETYQNKSVIVAVESTPKKITTLLFDNGITQPITGSNSVALTGSTLPLDIDLVQSCGNWLAFVADLGNHFFRMDYSALNVAPVQHDLSAAIGFTENPYRLRIVQDGSEYFGLIATISGGSGGELVRLLFGTNISNNSPVKQNLGAFGILGNAYNIAVAKTGSKWYGYMINGGSSALYKLDFPNPCSASPSVSSLTSPVSNYASSGTYDITLKAANSLGQSLSMTKTITVSSSVSPDIDFTSQNVCAGANVDFSSSSGSGGISTYLWKFGDAATSGSPSPSHTYASAGPYTVNLLVTGSNGCQNSAQKPLTIYNQPTANFTLPAVSPVCTNQNYTFTNTSIFDVGTTPTWEWRVNNVLIATTQNLTYPFPSTAAQTIKLKAIIPGCSNEIPQTLSTILTGPVVDFSGTVGCQGTSLQFTNNTVGTGLLFGWDFGDGNTSTATSPSHTYVSFGPYSTNLSATAPNGCQNSATKTVTIYSTPQPDFTLDLPPFSCSGSPSQFNDATPTPTDSNLAFWNWTFGDPANGSATGPNPLYTYALAGPYSVDLTVTTNFGCQGTIQKAVTIAASPVVSFTNEAPCVNQGTLFTDTSTGSISSWQWKIGTSNYTYSPVTHVFATPGNYSAQLTVTDFNSCVAQLTKPIVVPVGQSPDFSSMGTCATKPAGFADITTVSSDPLIAYSWDFAGFGTRSGSPVVFTFPSTGNFPVTMDATAQSGCVYSVTKTVAIVAPPVSNFTPSTDAGAAPLVVQFTNASSNAISYVWHFHDSTDSTTTEFSPSFVFQDLGDYVVDLDATDNHGCVDTHSHLISAVVPRVDASVASLEFVSDPSGSWQAVYIIDNKGNLPLTNPSILVDLSGNVMLRENLTLTVPPGQSTSQVLRYSLLPGDLNYVCVKVETPSDVDDSNDKQCGTITGESIELGPYPNPTEGELHIDWITSAPGQAQLTIFNSTGAKAFYCTVDAAGAGLSQIKLDISAFSPGVYMMVFNDSGQKKSFRFVVQ